MAFSRHQALISVLMFHPRDTNFTPCAAARDYVIDLIGSGGGTRTPDTRIMIATLGLLTLRAAHRCMARRLTICILVTPVLPTPHRALAEISLCSPLHFQIATANRADTVLWTFASGFF